MAWAALPHSSNSPALISRVDQLHNVAFAQPMDLAILLGDEFGDPAGAPALAFVANPNSPTCTYADNDRLAELAERLDGAIRDARDDQRRVRELREQLEQQHAG